MKKLLTTILAGAMVWGLAGCGEEVERPVADKYVGVYKVVEDLGDNVLPKDEKGDLEIHVLPLDSGDVNMSISGWHNYGDIEKDFKYSNEGYVEGNWSYRDVNITSFYVDGVIYDDRINLDACVEHLNFQKNYKYLIEWELKGIKARR